MANPSSSPVQISSLLCQEAENCSLNEHEQDPSLQSLVSCHGGSDSEEYVTFLLEKEMKKKKQSSNSSSSSSMSIGRQSAVNFILNSREILGFQCQTAYLSVTYLDRFLTLRSLEVGKPWAMELLSMGCVSLAVKMQESDVWDLSSLQIGDFEFEIGAIRRMELLILSTLDWKMGSITPFAFLPYFIGLLFTKHPHWSALARILELIMAFMKDVSLMDHHPSAIAFAAVLLSFDQSLTRKTLGLKIEVIPCGSFIDLEDVFTCYNIIRQFEREKCKTPPKLLASSDSSPIRNNRNSHATSLINSKRKRLAFDEPSDQNQGLRNKQNGKSDGSK